MQERKVVSNDVCVAGLHQFIAVAANILYSLKGDLGSFIAQSKTITRSNIAAIYSLHTKDNMPEALEGLEKIPVGTKELIMESDYPEAVRFEWLKFVLLFENFLNGIKEHEVCSEPQDYIDSAKKLLDTVNSFQKLAESLSTNVELVAVRQDLNGGLSQLLEFEDIFSATYKLAQGCGLAMGQIEKQKKQNPKV